MLPNFSFFLDGPNSHGPLQVMEITELTRRAVFNLAFESQVCVGQTRKGVVPWLRLKRHGVPSILCGIPKVWQNENETKAEMIQVRDQHAHKG